MNFRDLTRDDIDVRLQSVKVNKNDPSKSGVILLLYKNARVDMNILDETVGPENWQREHYECKGNLFCRVGIRVQAEELAKAVKENICGDGYDAIALSKSILDAAMPSEWIWKSDCGVESNTEAQKGEASDSFKRACFNWGIGRELYTTPLIWVKAADCRIDDNGKCWDKFAVEAIRVQDKKITGLLIYNLTQKKRCFSWEIK